MEINLILFSWFLDFWKMSSVPAGFLLALLYGPLSNVNSLSYSFSSNRELYKTNDMYSLSSAATQNIKGKMVTLHQFDKTSPKQLR